jgi:hypothetical protein
MARHLLRIALVLWQSGQLLNRPCNSSEATKLREVNRHDEMANPTKGRDAL